MENHFESPPPPASAASQTAIPAPPVLPAAPPLPEEPASPPLVPDPAANQINIVEPSRTLAIVDSGTRRILFYDVESQEIVGKIKLNSGDWRGLCVCGQFPHILLAIADTNSNTVQIFDVQTMSLVRSIGLSCLRNPYFVCVHQPAGEQAILIVSDSGRNSVDLFDLDSGTRIRTIGIDGSPTSRLSNDGKFKWPAGVVVWTPLSDPSNPQVVVADAENNRLQLFRLSDGAFLRGIPNSGGDRRILSKPGAISIYVPTGGGDEETLLLTVGWEDSRIHVYAIISGEHLRCLDGGLGSGPQNMSHWVYSIAFYRPHGLAESETQVIISDRESSRLQFYNLYSGAYLASVGGRSSGLFELPRGMAFLSTASDEWDYVLK